jgi:hypothetical protein
MRSLSLRLCPSALEFLTGEEIHIDVTAVAEGWSELFQNEEDFLIVSAGVLLWVDVSRTDLPGILPTTEVRPGAVIVSGPRDLQLGRVSPLWLTSPVNSRNRSRATARPRRPSWVAV